MANCSKLAWFWGSSQIFTATSAFDNLDLSCSGLQQPGSEFCCQPYCKANCLDVPLCSSDRPVSGQLHAGSPVDRGEKTWTSSRDMKTVGHLDWTTKAADVRWHRRRCLTKKTTCGRRMLYAAVCCTMMSLNKSKLCCSVIHNFQEPAHQAYDGHWIVRLGVRIVDLSNT